MEWRASARAEGGFRTRVSDCLEVSEVCVCVCQMSVNVSVFLHWHTHLQTCVGVLQSKLILH